MALVPCRNCGSSISDQAFACPRCGASLRASLSAAVPTRPGSNSSGCMIAAIVIAVVTVTMAGAAYLAFRYVFGDAATDRAFASAVKAPLVLRDEVISVPAKTLAGRGIDLPYDGEVTLEVEVVKGKHVNVYLIDAGDWPELEKAKDSLFGGRFHHYKPFEATESTRVKRTARLKSGAYFVVVENPTFGILVASSFDLRIKATLRP